jgi:elongator complex protein 1
LYHRSNYHWYLKRQLQYEKNILPGKIEFDKLSNMTLMASLHYRGSELFECRQYDFFWDFSVSQCGIVAVIDGNNLNITHLDKALVPPPMCAYTVEVEHTLSEVSFVPSYMLERCQVVGFTTFKAVATSGQGFLIFIGSRTHLGKVDHLERLAAYDMTGDETMLPYSSSLRQYTVVQVTQTDSNSSLLVTLIAFASLKSTEARSWNNDEEIFEMIFKLDIGCNMMKTDPLVKVSLQQLYRHKMDGEGMRIAHWIVSGDTNPSGHALIQLRNSSIYEFKSRTDSYESLTQIEEPELCFPEPCPQFNGMLSENKRVIIGVSKRSRLYIGERLLHHSVSSLALSPNHKIMSFATLGSSSYLHFIPFDSLINFDPLSALEDNALEGYESRNLERGSILITMLAHRPETVLLLPRGNLELLCPRGLLIPFVTRLLQQRKYSEAFIMIRKQKLDVNLLCDVNPSVFLMGGGIESFLEQVHNVDHINLFIAGLNNTDVTRTKYPILDWFGIARNDDGKSPFDFSTKVNRICFKMRSVMIAAQESGKLNTRGISSGDFLLPVLCTYAKEQPPQLEKALLLIKKISIDTNIDQRAQEKRGKVFSEKTQGAIQYLAFLSNYDILFDTALGLYDFELAKAVARNSQLDPKVYMPLLKHYNNIPIYRARYEVDLRLHRYESALRHLASYYDELHLNDQEDQNSFHECLNLIEGHKLHRLGLELFKENVWKQSKVMHSLGTLMMHEENFESALEIFLLMNPVDYKSVLQAARKCGDWQTYFAYYKSVKEEINTVDNSFNERAASIAREMISKVTFGNKRSSHSHAARIVLDYCNDAFTAVEILISGQLWLEARRVCVHYGLDELYSKMKDDVYAAAENFIADLEEKKEAFTKTIERYTIVLNTCRESKKSSLNIEFPPEGNDDTGSLFSMASKTSDVSIFSTSSRSSMSSVISAGQISSFSIVGGRSTATQPMLGKKKTKKQRSKKGKNKMNPFDELKTLATELKACVTDDEYTVTIVETLKFLSQESLVSVAVQLFQAYIALETSVTESIKAKMEEEEIIEESNELDVTTLEYVTEVKSLKCAKLPSYLVDIFPYIEKL